MAWIVTAYLRGDRDVLSLAADFNQILEQVKLRQILDGEGPPLSDEREKALEKQLATYTKGKSERNHYLNDTLVDALLYDSAETNRLVKALRRKGYAAMYPDGGDMVVLVDQAKLTLKDVPKLIETILDTL